MEPNKNILAAVLKSFGIPALIASAIILLKFLSPWDVPQKISEEIGSFFAIIFFLMYFYGQYKRVQKHTEDKESFKGVSEKLSSLEDLVRQLGSSTAPNLDWQNEPIFTSARHLIVEAKEILNQGYTLAALLQAGVAFEQAIRNFAQGLDIERASMLPLNRIFQSLSKTLPKDLLREFDGLREIRNKLVHISEDELDELTDAKTILYHYESAISKLSMHVRLVAYPFSSNLSKSIHNDIKRAGQK